MRTFIQLKDNVTFAIVNTDGETEGIEVPYGTGENFLKKKYQDGEWNDAPLITYAEVNSKGGIMEVRHTYFESEVGNNPTLNQDTDYSFKWVDGEWVANEIIDVEAINTPVPIETITSGDNTDEGSTDNI